MVQSFLNLLLNLNDGLVLQIVGLCQALNDVLDSMAKKGIPVPVWLGLLPISHDLELQIRFI